MQINCPNCGEAIAAENINIQKMVAVCSACDTVFPFETPTAKAKRRKVKQPQHLALRDTDDKLEMAFRTNFRLDKNDSFIGSSIVSFVFSLLTITMTGGALAGDMPFIFPIIFGLVTLFMYYWLGTVVYNKTHIEMNDERIIVTRKPLYDIRGIHEVSLSGAVAIRCEETAASKKENYDTPRYRVWAEMEDGRQRVIVNDVTEDYAYFIAQRLDERLHGSTDLDVSHLEDHEQDVEYLDDSEIISENTQTMFQEG